MLQKKFEEVFHFCMHSANTEARTPLKILMQQKITQTRGAYDEHKHSGSEHFSTLNERIISQNSKDSVIVSCQ